MLKTTINDIARLAGVNKSTVSRALGNSNRISLDLRQKIQKIAVQKGYRPNGLARELALKKATTIGIIVPDLMNPFFPTLINSVEEVARKAGFHVILGNSGDIPDREVECIETFLERRLAGIAVVPTESRSNMEYYKKLLKGATPIVFVDRAFREMRADCVAIDNIAGAREAVEYLIELGHKKIAHIRGPRNLSTAEERFYGYRDALEAHDIELDMEFVRQGDFKKESGRKAMRDLFELPERPTAVFVANDYMAAGALKAAAEHGARVPQDISVIGFDNLDFVSILDVSLTTVSQPVAEMGHIAAGRLIEIMEKGPRESRSVLLKPQLVIRGSCAEVAAFEEGEAAAD